MISAGLFTEWVTLLEPIVADNYYGKITEEYQVVKRTKARVQVSKASTIIRNGNPMMSQVIGVTLHYTPIAKSVMRIGWKGDVYRIDGFIPLPKERIISITAVRIDE